MTMTYTKDGDGYIVHDHDKAVCRVQTMNTEFLPEHKLPDGRVVAAEMAEKAMPREAWLFHFCAGRFTAQQLKELLDLMPRPEPSH